MKYNGDLDGGEKAAIAGVGCLTLFPFAMVLIMPVAWFALIVGVLYAIGHFALHWF